MADTLAGTDYVTPDILAKVTGRATRAEDFRSEGMIVATLLLSPMPDARVRRLDPRRALNNEPLYGAEPILSVAAVDQLTAAEAIERIDIELDPLPFVIDPIESLWPDGADARFEGNVWGVPPPPAPGQMPARPAGRGAPASLREDGAAQDIGTVRG
jgi:CO/xanthine dehydrogenase Mo-binding subunit